MSDTKIYRITLESYEDDTIFDMRLTDEEYELVKRISEEANRTSSDPLMPRMYVEEVIYD